MSARGPTAGTPSGNLSCLTRLRQFLFFACFSHFRVPLWHPAERSLSGRRAVYAMDVVEQYTLWMSRNSYGGLKLGLQTPHKVTADHLSVGQNKYPLGNLIRRRRIRIFLEFAPFSFVARCAQCFSSLCGAIAPARGQFVRYWSVVFSHPLPSFRRRQ